MDIPKLVEAFWPIIIAALAGFAWFIRLEAKVMYMEKEADRAEKIAAQDKTTLWAKMDSIQTTLLSLVTGVAKLEVKVESKRDH